MKTTYIATFPGNYVTRRSSDKLVYTHGWRVINDQGDTLIHGFSTSFEKAEKSAGAYTRDWGTSTHERRQIQLVTTTSQPK